METTRIYVCSGNVCIFQRAYIFSVQQSEELTVLKEFGTETVGAASIRKFLTQNSDRIRRIEIISECFNERGRWLWRLFLELTALIIRMGIRA